MAADEKMVSQFLLGSVLLGISVLLVVPSAVGILEYKSKAVPLPGGAHDKPVERRMHMYEIIQIIILACACVGFLFGFYVMFVSSSSKSSGVHNTEATGIEMTHSAVRIKKGKGSKA